MASQNLLPINFPSLKDKVEGKTPLLGALFLFCVIFITFLFVYFMYICTHQRRPNTGDDENGPAAGLDPATIRSLPAVSIGKKASTGECAICLSMFEEGELVKVLPLCHHRFHSDCVDKWLRTRSSCPLCRGGVIQITP